MQLARAMQDAEEPRPLSFGPFTLDPARHVLTMSGKPVRIGSRALAILIALTERKVGEVVSKEELIAKAWPNVHVVDEANLRTQIFELRRVLGDDRRGARYVTTVPGRGYRFVAPVVSTEILSPSRSKARHEGDLLTLPHRSAGPIGREEVVFQICQSLRRNRFITVTGPGGIGKTTVALAVGEHGAPDYPDGVVFVDLVPIDDRSVVEDTIYSAIRSALAPSAALETGAPPPLDGKRILIILDNCERIIETCATVAEKLFGSGTGVHILATSREALRAETEQVFRLQPLAAPPDIEKLSPAEAQRYPAVQLFVERARAHVQGYELCDENAGAVAQICRKLDGIALAIELAAGQIEAFGTSGVAERLNDWFKLAMRGRRTALPRHQTLGDTLDWSFETLSPEERRVLLRLSCFAGRFSLEGACAVGGEGHCELYRIIASLVGKSLVDVDDRDRSARYRLLDTTRLYCLRRLLDSEDASLVFNLHARHVIGQLESLDQGSRAAPPQESAANLSRYIGDIRVALDRAAESEEGDDVFIALVLAALPVWLHLAFYRECRTHVEAALRRLQRMPAPEPEHEMRLFLALGTTLAYLKGAREQAEGAFAGALQIAEHLGDVERQLRALWGLWSSRFNGGQLAGAFEAAERFRTTAAGAADVGAAAVGERLLAASCLSLGDFRGTEHHLTIALHDGAAWTNGSDIARFRFDQRVAARSLLGMTCWILGCPDRAVREAESALSEANALAHPLSQALALERACSVFILNGSLDRAEAMADALASHADRHGLDVWRVLAACGRAVVLVARGRLDTGLRLMSEMIAAFPREEFQVRHTGWRTRWAEALGLAGRYGEALVVISKLMEEADARQQSWCQSDLLCVKGHIHQARGELGDIVSAEAAYRAAIARANEQQALSWELRSAIGLARLWRSRGRIGEARDLITPIYARFTEGFDTLDLAIAREFFSSPAS